MQSFVRTWNIHRIRKQPKRPNVVAGKPVVLYHYPPKEVSNYGLSVPKERLELLKNDVREWSMYEIIYLSLYD